jgi:CheY-like chemotaxis protein
LAAQRCRLVLAGSAWLDARWGLAQLEVTTRAIRRICHPTCAVRAGAAASAFIDSGQSADVMLLDITMPLKNGVDVMTDCLSRPPAFPIVSCGMYCAQCTRWHCVPCLACAPRVRGWPGTVACLVSCSGASCAHVESLSTRPSPPSQPAAPQIAMTGHVDLEAREQFRYAVRQSVRFSSWLAWLAWLASCGP